MKLLQFFFRKDRLEYSYGAFVSDAVKDLLPEALYRNRVGFDDKAPTSAVKPIHYYLKSELTDDLKNNLIRKLASSFGSSIIGELN